MADVTAGIIAKIQSLHPVKPGEDEPPASANRVSQPLDKDATEVITPKKGAPKKGPAPKKVRQKKKRRRQPRRLRLKSCTLQRKGQPRKSQ